MGAIALKRSPLRRVSSKRARALKAYRVNKQSYLSAHPTCEVCDFFESTDIHHKLPLGRGGKLNDVTIFLAVCRECHIQIHDNPLWAEEQGYLFRYSTNAQSTN